MKIIGVVMGAAMLTNTAHAAMWASQNGAALYPLAAEAGTYTSCTRGAASAVNDHVAVIAMSCAINDAFGFAFTVPQGETPTVLEIAASVLGTGGDAETACVSWACGCGGNATTELDRTDLTYGTAALMTITSATTWDATESKTTVVADVDLENGGEYRSCECRAVRLATSGACTDNYDTELVVESVAFKW